MPYSLLPVILAVLSMWQQPGAVDHAGQIWLDVPEQKVQIEADGVGALKSDEVTYLDIHLNKKPGQVNYGQIFTKVNTESANIVMTVASASDGIICHIDLTRRGGFKLHTGRNSIEVAYYDAWMRLHYTSFLLNAGEGEKYIWTESKPDHFTAEKYAVVVGISKYRNNGAGLANLKYADRDAMALRDFLLSPASGGFKKENIKYLVNEDATTENIRSAFFTFLARAKENDLVVIYYAGHGAADPNDPRNLYLLTYDTLPSDMGRSALRMFELQEVFSRVVKAKRMIVFTDSCHSYGISGERPGGNIKSNNLINQYLAKLAEQSDRAIITASDVSQVSMESDQWGGGHGVFTHFLIKGLNGEADLNKDGTVTAGELFQYVREQVQKATTMDQTPVALPGLAEQMPLSGVGVTGPKKDVVAVAQHQQTSRN